MNKHLNKHKLIEDVKNTNYKMHKSKKGWVVSYSLLTLMLGGLFFDSTSFTQNVKASEIESQNNQQQSSTIKSSSQDISAARENAQLSLKAEADKVKHEISSDNNLSNSKKQEQLKTVDTIFNKAKDKIDQATTLVDIKVLVANETLNINSCYKITTTQATVTHNKNIVVKNKKIVSNKPKKRQSNVTNKTTNKKAKVTSYSGLNSFLKSSSVKSATKLEQINKHESSTASQQNDNQTKNIGLPVTTPKEVTSSNVPKAINLSAGITPDSDNHVVDQRSTKSAVLKDGLPLNPELAADDADSKEITVSPDVDNGRKDFEENIGKSTNVSPTSLDIAVPDQILNPDKYQQKSVDVDSFSALAKAWADRTVTYINITKDISYTGGTIRNRAAGASVVINGNGHTVDLGNQDFGLGAIPSTNPTTITLTNTKYQQGYTTNDGLYGLVYATSGYGLTVNVDKINLSASSANKNNPIHVVYASNALVNFSGDNNFNISNEVTRAVTKIMFSNKAHVTMQRTANDAHFSEFFFLVPSIAGTAGYGNVIMMGNDSSNTAYTNNGSPANFPAVYLNINGITTGDNVKWEQSGFQYFINGTQGSSAGAKFKFGQNFNLKAPFTTQPGAIKLEDNQIAEFGAGTVFDINQRANGAVIQVDDSSSVSFTSPKQLHLAVQDNSGNPASSRTGIIAGTGSVTLNNSNVSTWSDANSSIKFPDGNNTAQFTKMVVQNGRATLTDLNGKTTSSNIVTSTTRELQTNALPVGKILVQYVDQNGKKIGDPVAISLDKDAYIGQFIPLNSQEIAVKNLPKNYMWAIGDQVYAGAKTDKQSRGDSTSTTDNGDEFGQAQIGIVPMKGQTYTYNVYVYGVKEKATYQYIDINNPDKVLTSKLSGKAGDEAVGNKIPANYGNTINWQDEYYTKDNVPENYHYVKDAPSQATTMLVGENNPVVNIYVAGDTQTITPTYEDKNGKVLNPSETVKITGAFGEEVAIPKAPEIQDYAFDHVEIDGQKVANDTKITINSTTKVKYVYHALSEDKSQAKTEIDNEAKQIKEDIAKDPTLDDAAKTAQQGQVDTDAKAAKDAIDQAENAQGVKAAKDQGITKIDGDHKPNSTSLTDQKSQAKTEIDNEAKQIKEDIAKDPTLDDAAKTAQQGQVDTDAKAAKDAIDQAENAQGVKAAKDQGITKIDGDHKPNSTSLTDQKSQAKTEIDNEAKQIKEDIAKDPTLDDAAKTAQQGQVDTDAKAAKDAIDQAENAQGVKAAKDQGITKIDGDHKPNKNIAVTIKYVDAAGKEIHPETTVQAEVGKDYTAHALIIDGYEIDGNDSKTVNITKTGITITFNYVAKKAEAKQAPVTIKYVDAAGKEISPETTVQAEVGKDYTAHALQIAGYEIDGSESQTVTVGEKGTTITFKYVAKKEEAKQAPVTIKYVDATGKEISPETTVQAEVG
ncbi:DUF1542 domain-containing protein, partial [Lactobacillus sp. ESL0246]|uniref:MucBP domain-containing protein n=1 Tax=Lactobacillus sp. ESL0246 TaxID=2069359 RepID=UPI000EFBEFE3